MRSGKPCFAFRDLFLKRARGELLDYQNPPLFEYVFEICILRSINLLYHHSSILSSFEQTQVIDHLMMIPMIPLSDSVYKMTQAKSDNPSKKQGCTEGALPIRITNTPRQTSL